MVGVLCARVRKIMRAVRILVVVLSMAGAVAAAQTSVGSTLVSSFHSAWGGRALALGGAYVALANDVTAGYWNRQALPISPTPDSPHA